MKTRPDPQNYLGSAALFLTQAKNWAADGITCIERFDALDAIDSITLARRALDRAEQHLQRAREAAFERASKGAGAVVREDMATVAAARRASRG